MDESIAEARTAIHTLYAEHGRHDLPWRTLDANGQLNPYRVVVSELMLQQTQVPRVIPKFNEFVRLFPSFEALAASPLGDVLRAWSGLGYNRRAKFLWQTAGAVAGELGGRLPRTRAELVRLPGIGSNTAGAILAYAFNQPAVFVETNIRSVCIHHFFAGQEKVTDSEIASVLEKLLLGEPDPRTFYWALMDYGTFLKQTAGNAARRSAAYAKQSAFHGSRRQIRGQVLRTLAQRAQTAAQLAAQIADERLPGVLEDLAGEGMIVKRGETYYL